MRWIAIVIISILIQVLFIDFVVLHPQEDLFVELIPSKFHFSHAFSAYPCMIMLFSFHLNQYAIYKNMRNPSDKKFTIASILGNTFIAILFGFVGIFGYMSLGEDIKQDIEILQYIFEQKKLK
ncbi:hypothetical protein PPERSA_11720 [Pseudocohnilembus persalinus]|uniref:Amino acid transporter transmembrane domain-containing protein n=1 Tax=Pseudocohnilembus persalinus TaxID=266149 RepID=A0A0V0QGA7_PSEPJ|nr:hypothetical protein PPERSA_11720 [Pseudocohnilembus persalinus]|eukprot:KRX01273.1 hypothetical protein PPERSA_11720 [Pseudocohnilembus persalinus]